MRLPNAILFECEIPIEVDGNIIGAIGVRRGTSEQDGIIARSQVEGIVKTALIINEYINVSSRSELHKDLGREVFRGCIASPSWKHLSSVPNNTGQTLPLGRLLEAFFLA